MAITYSAPTITVTGGIDSGTATSGTPTTLTDTLKNWTPNAYAGRYVWVYGGTGVGQSRMILSNTATVLTIESGHDFDTAPASGSTYRISYNWDDVYQADVGGGWGVVANPGDITYYCTAVLKVANTGYLGCDIATIAHIKYLSSPPFLIDAGGRYQQGRRKNGFGYGGGVLKIDTGTLNQSHIITTGGGAPSPGDFYLYGAFCNTDGFFNLYKTTGASNRWEILDCQFDKFAGRFENGTSGNIERVRSLGQTLEYEDTLVNVIQPEPTVTALELGNATYGLYCYADFGGATYRDLYWRDLTYLLLARRELANTFVDIIDPDPRSDFSATVYYDPAHFRGSNSPKVRMYTTWFPYVRVSGVYETGATFRVIDNTSAEVFLDTTAATPTPAELLWRLIVYSNSVTNYNDFNIVVTRYGYQVQRFTRALTRVAKYVDDSGSEQRGEIVTLLANSFLVANEATANGYGAKITITGATSLMTVSTASTIQELYDYYNYWENTEGNLQYIQSESHLTTADGSSFNFGSFDLTLSGVDLTGSGTLNIGANNVNLNSGAETTLTLNGGTINIDTVQAYVLTLTTNTVNFTTTGTYDLTGCTITGTVTFTATAAVTVQVAIGTLYDGTHVNVTVVEIGDIPTLTVSADSTTATVRGFTNDTQTTVFSESDGSVAYEYPNTNPIDIEIVEQGYVPINDQNVVPFDGPINYTMDIDEAYNASHSLTIVTHYTYNRGTKTFAILADQNAFDVRSSMADTIRTSSSYYNTPLLLEAKPGGKRIDLIDGATITSMETWKGAGMERYDALGTIYPIEKWYAIQSVQDITGASVIYRQTNSGDFTIGALTGGKFDETLKFYEDTTVPPDNSPETNNNSYLLIKALRVGYRQARNDVVAGNGGASLKADLYTIGLAPTAHDYAGGPIDLSATMTLVAGGTVGGKTFAYKWVDAGTNSGTDIADWINYMGATTPNGLIPGSTGLRWAEMPDMVIYVSGGVETAQGYREGATPTLVGFYLERGGADHPDLVRAQADDGTYYTPAQSATATISNFATTSRLQIYDTLNAVELYNGVPGATSYQFSETYSVDRDIRVRITNKVTTTASIMIEATVGSITASNPDVAYIANQSADTTYNNNAVDGDTVTGITINDTTDRVEIGIAGGSVPWKDIYAYQVAWLHTEAGIRDDFAFIDAPDTANYILTGFKIKNTSSPSVPLVITGGYGRDATTGASIDLIDTTGGSLFFAPDHVIPYATGSGVTSADKTEIIAGVTSSVSDTLPDAVWQSPKAIPKLLSVE